MLSSHVENRICHWQQRGSNWKFYSKVKGGRYRGRDHILNSDVELRNWTRRLNEQWFLEAREKTKLGKTKGT